MASEAAPQGMSVDARKRYLVEIKLSFCPLLIHHRMYLNKRLLSAHSSHTSCVFMPLGVIRCVGIPADASVLDCGVCPVVSTLEASQHQCGVVELNGKKNLGRC